MSGKKKTAEAHSPTLRPPSHDDLSYRLHQQSVLADFGRRALQAEALDDLLEAAVQLCADGMHARFCMAAEHLPDRNGLRLRAGVGWRPGVVGREVLDMDSPAGVAFLTGTSVIADHPADGPRFRTPPLLTEHGIKRTVVVPVPLGGGRRWGALVAHSPDKSGRWDEADVEFMTGMARLLGVAIERRDAQRALDENRAWLDVLLDSVDQVVWSARPDGHHDYFNRRWYEFCGAEPGTTDGDAWAQWLHPDDRERTFAAWRRSLETGAPYEIEYRFRNRAGEYRWTLGRAHPVRDTSGRIIRWIGTGTDVTEQQEAAELQRTLLQEVSHRVKNSLALISGLLTLQSHNLEGGPRHALEEAAARVHAVARVHDQLWRGADARHIDLQAFLCDLSAAIATGAPRHATVCRAEPAVVNADLAGPLGLLVNELLTNAYKYAYAPGEEGEVRLLGARLPDDRYRLEVSDSGRGLPEGFDLRESRKSLGMRVITSLAAQLGGELTAGSADPGARFTLEFPLSEGESQPPA